MDERISTIKKVDLRREDMLSMVMFDRGLSGQDLKFLEDEFDFYRTDADKFTASYKNVGIVFKLNAIQEDRLQDWKMFVQKVIKKTADFDKFHNIFVSKYYDKVLLVTNKRLLNIDLKKLNEKIENINYRIESYDEKLLAGMEEVVDAAKGEHKGIFSRIVEVLRK